MPGTESATEPEPAPKVKAVFRANLQHIGVYDAKGVHEFSEVKWKFKTEGLAISFPAIADGIVYFGSADGHLYAVDISTGLERWKFDTEGGGIVSSPAIADGVVYFGSKSGSV